MARSSSLKHSQSSNSRDLNFLPGSPKVNSFRGNEHTRRDTTPSKSPSDKPKSFVYRRASAARSTNANSRQSIVHSDSSQPLPYAKGVQQTLNSGVQQKPHKDA